VGAFYYLTIAAAGEFEFEAVAPGCDAAFSSLRPPHGEVGTKIGK